MLNIDGFPHAHYDSVNRFGYLAYYYPFAAAQDQVLTAEDWRNRTYSPEILDYKEGRDDHITFFVAPFLELIRCAVAGLGADAIFLVAVPSSMPATDPQFSRIPRQRGGGQGKRNRDDRNVVFCQMLANAAPKLKVADILRRSTRKPEKETWTKDEHASSFSCLAINEFPAGKAVLIAIDDVRTDGGTLNGAKAVLERVYPKATVVGLTIACTRAPQQFEPLP